VAFRVESPSTSWSPFMRKQKRLNRASAHAWEAYAHHRARVTEVILDRSSAQADRLVVLGAGNCNDLDLTRLAPRFAEIHLVDIDAAALARAAARQNERVKEALRLHGQLDVGTLVRRRVPALESADTVVSAAVLSQLISTAVDEGRAPGELLEVRDSHLRTMSELLRPGGAGVLITDVVSSDTCPELRTTRDDQLPALLTRTIGTANFFTGCNPFTIARRLGTDPAIRAERIGVGNPWRWDLGDRRSHLVCAVTYRRRKSG
jgi:hypothetical protein